MAPSKTTSLFRGPLEAALRHALEHHDGLDTGPVAPTASLETSRGRLGRLLTNDATPAQQVIADLVADSEGGIMGDAGGRFYAWVMGGAVPARDQARALTLGIGGLAGAEVLGTPVIDQAPGETFFGGVTGQGKRAMRISVCNWMTTGRDAGRVIAAFARIPEARPQ